MNSLTGINFNLCWLISLVFLSSCLDQREDIPAIDENNLTFHAYTSLNEEATTRANTNTVNILAARYGDVDFHIYENGIDRTDTPRSSLGSYFIRSGNSGFLESKDNGLNWFSRLGKHEFWSWTTPWTTEPPSSHDPINIVFRGSPITETTTKDANYFEENSWRNGHDLELFIGSHTSDLTYAQNGEYVSLCYQHLVSKIFVNSFTLVNNATMESPSGLRGNITFYGLPESAIFYPTGAYEDGTPVLDSKGQPYNRPVIVKQYVPGQKVTYAITNTTSHPNSKPYYNDNNSQISYKTSSGSNSYSLYDCWFICPEVDFKDITFKIEIFEFITGEGWVPNRTYGLNGAFYGDFKNVSFSRTTTGSNYDTGDGSDKTVLHAGEYLILSFNLTTKGNASVKGTISDWSNATQSRQATTHSQDGLYTFQESKSLSDIMKEGDEDKIREYYENFGSRKKTSDYPDDPNYEDDLDIIKLMDDIGYNGTGTSTSGTSAKMDEFYVADGYIIDGQGHTINMTSSNVKIGKIRDVYLRYYTSKTTNGVTTYTEYIVYIDYEGKVWIVDPETYRETETDFNINDSTTNPFSLNLSTGEIK